ncbi:MAG: N-acetyl-gamma-glutamyl-phosphate reductase [Lentisphaerae bacterium]|nr:N-acetyl-gamma-glutamyl-phosphate reductase [Lentisphaerota bacterium]
MSKTRVAIVGASGYSGEELLRLLLHHPSVEVTCITSRQEAGRPVGAVFPRYMESSLKFSQPDIDDIAAKADVAFLALPHGLATEFAVPLLKRKLKVIDISADFRIHSPEIYAHYYKTAHPAPELLAQAVYGLPEVYRRQIKGASLIACPGCYPTSILLPIIPLLRAGLVEPDGITVVSMSGVSGAGRKVDAQYIFPECNESVRPYSVISHRHLPEIEQELALAAGCKQLAINFVPHLVPVNRGIHSCILLQANNSCNADTALECLHASYDFEPFVRILDQGQLADTKHVTMSNFCEIGCAFDPRNNRLIISSAIDNLTKGAAGQAVQNLNIIAGYPETAGLL